jgi:hypothetical protein
MKTKFKPDETCWLDGETEVEIAVAKKDFKNKSIKYRLKSDNGKTLGMVVDESRLSKVKSKAAPAQTNLLDEYKELFQKNVPAKYKNNEDWIQNKIDAKKAELENAEKYNAIADLDADGLIKLIEDKELDIDVDEFEEISDLLEAICEKLEIKVPE